MKLLKTLNIMPMVRNLGLFFSLILTVVFSLYAAQYPTTREPYIPALSSNFYYEKSRGAVEGLTSRVDLQTFKFILETDLPVISEKSNVPLPNAASVAKICLNLLAGVKLTDPLSYLKSEIPMMDVVPVTAEITDEFSPSDVTEPSKSEGDDASGQEPVVNKISSSTPLIALYNTHTSETYELTDGLDHLKGKAGGVSLVAKEIEKVIRDKYKIAAVYSPIIHDLSYNKSYVESEKTVKQLLKDNPKIEMVFDIHRDGMVSRENSVARI
ncbi:MAG TPA: stage II sporulation protein P, partial [Desulfobacteria bacterium]|nr:stage II sporulation protein P [Desulfobacteria bacterium]